MQMYATEVAVSFTKGGQVILAQLPKILFAIAIISVFRNPPFWQSIRHIGVIKDSINTEVYDGTCGPKPHISFYIQVAYRST